MEGQGSGLALNHRQFKIDTEYSSEGPRKVSGERSSTQPQTVQDRSKEVP